MKEHAKQTRQKKVSTPSENQGMAIKMDQC